jgi:hypothetical protein
LRRWRGVGILLAVLLVVAISLSDFARPRCSNAQVEKFQYEGIFDFLLNLRRRVHQLETHNEVPTTCHSKGISPALRKQPAEKYLSRFFAVSSLIDESSIASVAKLPRHQPPTGLACCRPPMAVN